MSKPANIFALQPTAAQSGTAAEPQIPQPAAVPESAGLMAEQIAAVIDAPLQRATFKLEAATRFLESRYIENLIVQAVTVAQRQAMSPFCDREGAAAFALCDVSQIDRAAKAGIIKRHLRGGTPLFEKADIAAAITSGKWRSAPAGK